MPRQTFTEGDCLEMQLDTRAERYDAIRDLVLETVADDDVGELLRRARMHVAAWDGHAGTEQTGFRILHVFYRALTARAATRAGSQRRSAIRLPLAARRRSAPALARTASSVSAAAGVLDVARVAAANPARGAALDRTRFHTPRHRRAVG